MHCLILPGTSKGTWRDVGLNDLSIAEFPSGDNPMKSAEFQESWLGEVKSKLECDYTYGGFLEDRSHLLRGFEEAPHMLHLGIDINNLQPGSPVTTPCDARVHHVMTMTCWNGWGARVILEMDVPYNDCRYLLYGHLDPDSLVVEEGSRVRRGDVVGKIGDIAMNGVWFRHLHVQLNTDYFMQKYENKLDKLDGYALTDEEVKEVDKLVSDPTELVFSK